MGSRLELHETLADILGSRNVYYQPPPSVVMKYPAIVYSRSNIRKKYASNTTYKKDTAYDVTLISTNPDINVVDKLSSLPKCSYSRHYVTDNLYHDTFTLYF